MGTRNLEKFFNPRRVALVGADDQPSTAGATVLRNLLNPDFRGVIYPVNPRRESVMGIQAYPSLAELPRKPELVVLCGNPRDIPDYLAECAGQGVPAVLAISNGFRESDDPGRELEHRLLGLLRQHPNTRLLGPDSLGLVNPRIGLNASFTQGQPKAGHLAFISQSGALANAVLDRAEEKGMGFSCFVSPGLMLDVGFGDLLDYFGFDAHTRATILYVQSIEQARRFMSAARAFARGKPIIAYKAGHFAESARAAASHTGAMAAEDAVYDAAFQRAGVVRVWELDNLFDVAEVLACKRLPRGARLAIISNAGGPAIVATDALLFRKGRLAELEETTLNQLRRLLPKAESGNPLDLGDHAQPNDFAEATRALLQDAQVDAILVILTPQVPTDPTESARQVAELARRARKPVLAAWMGGKRVQEGIRLLNEAGIPAHSTPEQATRAFMHLVSYARNLEILYETPREIPLDFNLNRRKLHKKLNHFFDGSLHCLGEHQAKCLLKAYDIPVCDACLAYSSEDAVRLARQIGYPVVVKVLSPQIIHKIDVGGVALNLRNAEEVRLAFKGMQAITSRHALDAEIRGVTVQRMVSVENGVQMILGAKKDPTFGPVIMAGMGGVTTGVLQDRALGLPPLNERLARRMLEALRAWPLLQGYRGQPAVNLERLIEIMIRFSYLVADYPEIQEIDVNPLLVTPEDVLALDAAVILDNHLAGGPLKPYQHLAIRPYPEEYIRKAELRDGSPVVMRPIRPEDEPLWQALLTNSSPESLRFRFRSLFSHVTHEMATRHCFIDYEREISMVGEIQQDQTRELIGVGGLSADMDGESAEFAVIVADQWQGKGLGGMLLDYCLEIATRWGVKRIVAETDPRNNRMLASFRKRGFTSKVEIEDDVVYLFKDLD